MILSVTMNPSVDIYYPLETLVLDGVNRVDIVRKTAGGKGLNVARVIHQLDGDVTATGLIGGTLGNFIVNELNKHGIVNAFIETEKESRNCIAIVHEGKQTEILESGPTISVEEGQLFLQKFESLLTKVSLVTISGSLPKGIESSFYHQLLILCNQKGIKVILDASGEPLRQALLQSEKLFAIKPNLEELVHLIGRDVHLDNNGLIDVLSDNLFASVECVLVSLGRLGAFVKYKEVFYRVKIPEIEVINPVGSGDATVAGMAVALQKEDSIKGVFASAMAAGMANAIEAGTGTVNLQNYKRFYDMVEVIEI
ncbi:hexose kinase [Fredinandcohnia onubensis]|uniref:hexose kinase n=1 Tax=Fredinandcohnia onubensis TaxID=1571209 RepID=UPI000C0BCB30|nr:hexose kinase [Fredinandcohnia onubensis]